MPYLPTLLSAEDKLKEKFDRCRKYIEDALDYSGGTHYPQIAVCRIWLAGGNLEELMRAEKSISVWAKSHGCDAMEINGRIGWKRQLKDYTATSVVLTKDLRDE